MGAARDRRRETAGRGAGVPPRPGWRARILEGAVFAGLFAAAFGVRLLHLYQIRDAPFFEALFADARSYFEWAGTIRAGAWLGDGVFYQAPLYPYFLALVQLLVGEDLWGVRVVQIALGAAACGLLFLAGKSFLSPGAGVAAGLLLALYPAAIFFDGLIQKATLGLFLMTLLLWLLGLCARRPGPGRWLGVGVVLGLLGLTRENALLLAVVVPVWLAIHFARHGRRRRLVWGGCYAAGLMIVLLPVGARNYHVGGEFILTTSQLGPNFFMGNNAKATGTYMELRPARGTTRFERIDATRLAERAEGRSLSPREVSAYWLGRAWEFIRTQPGAWLRLMGKKWALTWNAFEIADAEDLYMYGEWSAVLAVLGRVSHFGVVCPLAAAGVVLTWRRRRDLWLLYALVVVLSVSVALFFVFARYRFPLVPVLLPFAGAALVEGYAALRKRRLRLMGVASMALAGSAVMVNWPILPAEQQRALACYNLGTALKARGRYEEAVEQYRRSLAADPSHGVTHNKLGESLLALDRVDEAIAEYKEAIRLQPQNADAHYNLGNVLLGEGKAAEAEARLREALRIDPEHVGACIQLGDCLVGSGRTEQGIVQFTKALRVDPDSTAAYSHLSLALIQTGRFAEAIEVVRRGRSRAPENLHLGNALARLLATAPEAGLRDGAEAVRIAERMCELSDYGNARVLDTLAAAYAEAGRFERAKQIARRGIEVARRANEPGVAAVIADHLKLYEAGRPFHTTAQDGR